jgi:hypothetical protein
MVGCKGERDVTDETREHLQSWLARFLWHWHNSGLSNGQAAEVILSILEERLPISEKTLSRPLQAPLELVEILESQDEIA